MSLSVNPHCIRRHPRMSPQPKPYYLLIVRLSSCARGPAPPHASLLTSASLRGSPHCAKINFHNYCIHIFYHLNPSCSSWEHTPSLDPKPCAVRRMRAGLHHGMRSLPRCLSALCSAVIARGGVLLGAVPRFFLLPPVPCGYRCSP
jgi:hypothetical protein